MAYTDNKPFCRENWEKYDQLSKEPIKKLADQLWSADTFEHHDEYLDGKCGDLVVIHRKSLAARVVETEIKNHWPNGRGPFPYKTVRFPQRKQLAHFKSVAVFCVVSADGQGVLMFPRSEIEKAEPFSFQARNHNKPESWIEIDASAATLYQTDSNGDWAKIR